MEHSLKLVILLLALAAAVVTAQNSPEDFVEAHNAARAEVGVEPVMWDETVALYAEAYLELRRGDCLLKTSPAGGPYGENIFGGLGTESTAADAVKLWVSNQQYYDYDSNTCSAPPLETCLIYTQVVWRTSTAIGCARVVCDTGDRVIIVCNYSPPGNNLVGQRPY